MNELITVAILTYNRKIILRESLLKIFSQDYKDIEVIVVDNGSCDNTEDMLKNDFPLVQIIRENENLGASAINKAFKVAKGKFILVLDDDSYPTNFAIKKAIEQFENNKIGVVALNIFNKNLDWHETKYFEQFPLSFVGCGVIIRKNILIELNGYDPNIFIYQNELDLALNILNKNYIIYYEPGAVIIHNYLLNDSKINSILTPFRYKHFFISTYYIIRKNTSGYLQYRLLITLIINRLLILLKYNYTDEFIWALKMCFKKNKIINTPVQNRIQKKITTTIKFIDRDYFASQIKFVKKYFWAK